MLTLLFALASAFGADWMTLNHTEAKEGLRPIGFVQPHFAAITEGRADGLEGPLAAHEGEVPLFNRAYGPGSVGFGLQRARLGVRGTLGRPDLAAFLMFEAGSNGLTRHAPVVITDATASWFPIDAFGVRVGQQKLPLMEETFQAVPVAMEWVGFSNTAVRLTGENHVAKGTYATGFSGFRDVGAQVFGTAAAGPWAVGWAGMVGQGRSGGVDVDTHQDAAGRVQLARVFGESTGPFREELSLVVWGHTGGRTLDGEDVTRHRAGAAVHLELGEVWALAEGVVADGVIELGAPFPGGEVRVAADGAGRGAVISAGVRTELDGIGTLGFKARYDQASTWTALAGERRRYQSLTGGVELDPAAKIRILATYEHRVVTAPGGPAAVQGLLDQVGDRVDVQITARL